MNDDFNTIEIKSKKYFEDLKLSSSPILDKSILNYSTLALEKFIHTAANSKVLFEGHFLPKVAGEAEVNFGVELIDNHDFLKLYLLEPKDNYSPFLLKIKSIRVDVDFFEKFFNHRIVIRINDIQVIEKSLTSTDVNEFIPRNLIPREVTSWSYQIFPG